MKVLSAFNWIDLVVLACFLRIGYIAANKGFISELFKDIGIVLSLFLSFQFYPLFNSLLVKVPLLRSHSDLALFTSFIILGGGSYILFRYLRGIILALFKVESHYVIERWVSFFLGLGRAATFVSLVFFSFWLINISYLNKSMEKSVSFDVFSPVAPYVYKSIYGLCVKFFPTASFNKQAANFSSKKTKAGTKKKHKLRKSSKK